MSRTEPKPTAAAQRRAARHTRRSRNTWLGGLLIAGLAAALGLSLWLLQHNRQTAQPTLPAVIAPSHRVIRGDPMPEAAWPDLQGKLVRISDLAGRPVIVNAWATWCPPCQAEMPRLHELYLKYQDQGLELLAVNGSEEYATVQQFAQENPFTFPILLDPTGAALNKLGVVNFPTSILVGRDGLVQYIYIGELTPQAIQEVVIPLLKLEE